MPPLNRVAFAVWALFVVCNVVALERQHVEGAAHFGRARSVRAGHDDDASFSASDLKALAVVSSLQSETSHRATLPASQSVNPVHVLGLVVCLLLAAAGAMRQTPPPTKQEEADGAGASTASLDQAVLWWLGLPMFVHAAVALGAAQSRGTVIGNLCSWGFIESAVLLMILGSLGTSWLLRYTAVLGCAALLLAVLALAAGAPESPDARAAISGASTVMVFLCCLLVQPFLRPCCLAAPRTAFAAAWVLQLAAVMVEAHISALVRRPPAWVLLSTHLPMFCMGLCITRSDRTDRWLGLALLVLLLAVMLTTDASCIIGTPQKGHFAPDASRSLSTWFAAPLLAATIDALSSPKDALRCLLEGRSPTAFAVPMCAWVALPGAPLLAAALPWGAGAVAPWRIAIAAVLLFATGAAVDRLASRYNAMGGEEEKIERPEANGPRAEDLDLEKSSSPFVLPPAAALVPYRAKACLHELVVAMAETRPASPAVLSPWSSGSLTYGQLVDQTTKLARCLEALGLGSGPNVAVVTERSLALVVGFFGPMAVGGMAVPCEPTWPRQRQTDCMTFASVKAVVADETSRPGDVAEWPNLPIVLLGRDGCLLNGEALGTSLSSPLAVPPLTTAPAFAVWTSGSSGKPKAIIYSHDSVVHGSWEFARNCQMDTTCVSLMQVPAVWAIVEWQLFSPLLVGGSAVLVKPGGDRDIAYFASMVRDSGTTIFSCTPPFLDRLLDDFRQSGCGALRDVASVGTVLPMACVRRFHEICRGVRLHNFYGASETGCTIWTSTPEPTSDNAPVGFGQAHVTVVLLDERNNMIMQHGKRGQICFGGPLQRYWAPADSDKERFRHVEQFGELYLTGDNGRWGPYGLEVLGRMDRQVQINGIRVEPAEIEAAALACLGVQEAVCVAVSRDNTAVLVLFVTPGDADHESVKQGIAKLKPSYMVPHTVAPLQKMPMLPTGKFNIQELNAVAEDVLASSVTSIVDSLGIVRSVSQAYVHAQPAVECGFAIGMVAVIVAHWMDCGGEWMPFCKEIPTAGFTLQFVMRYIVASDFSLFVFIVGGGLLDHMLSKRVVLGSKEIACLAIWFFMGWPLCRAVPAVLPWFTPCSIHRWYLAMYVVGRVFLAVGNCIASEAAQVAWLATVLVVAYSPLAPRSHAILKSQFAYAVGLEEYCGEWSSVYDAKFLLCLFVYVLTFHYGERILTSASKWCSQTVCRASFLGLFSIVLAVHPSFTVLFGSKNALLQATLELAVLLVLSALLLGCFASTQPPALRWLGQASLTAYVVHAAVPIKRMPWRPEQALMWIAARVANPLALSFIQFLALLAYPVLTIAFSALIAKMLRSQWTSAINWLKHSPNKP